MTTLQAILMLGLLAYGIGFLLSIRGAVRAWRELKGARLIMLAWLGIAISFMRFTGDVSTNIDASKIGAGHVLEIAALLVSTAIIIFFALSRGIAPRSLRLPVVLLLFYAMGGLLTAAWAPAEKIVVWKAVQIIVLVLFMVVAGGRLAALGRYRQLIEVTYVIVALLMISSAIAALLVPEAAFKQLHVGGGGLFGVVLYSVWPVIHPNTLGIYAAIMVIVSLRRFMDPAHKGMRMYYGGLLFLSLAVQFAAQSRGSIVALLFGLLLMAFFWSRLRRIALVVVVLAGLAGGYLLATSKSVGITESVTAYIKRGQSDEQFESMSGRTELWQRGIKMIADRPLFGHGFQTGGRFGGAPYGIPIGTNLHNAHFQVMVDSGLVGYTLWVSFLLVGALRILKNRPKNSISNNEEKRFRVECIVLVAMLLVRTLAGRSMAGLDIALMLYFSLVMYSYYDGNMLAVKRTIKPLVMR